VLYLPIYTYFAGISVFKAPLFDVGLQAVVQGFLTAIVALLLYGRMVSLLGATAGAAFVALTPVVTGLSTHSGPAGSSVTITGPNFSGAAGRLQVLFGNSAASVVNVISDTQVVATAPADG